jgi:hypothetical protein
VDAVLSPELEDLLCATVVPVERDALLGAARSLLDLYRELAQAVASRVGIAYPGELDRMLSARLDQLA